MSAEAVAADTASAAVPIAVARRVFVARVMFQPPGMTLPDRTKAYKAGRFRNCQENKWPPPYERGNDVGNPAFLIRRCSPDRTSDREAPASFPQLNAGAFRQSISGPWRGEGQLARLATERNMPVIFLWGIPVLIVIGGGAYWIAHLH